MTNHVKVTLYYNREEPFFSTVSALLNEYHYANKRITIETVDYLRDAGAAQRVKAQYKLTFPTQTNLIIFDCDGKAIPVDGTSLTQSTLELVPEEKERTFIKRPFAFEGEKRFTSALLALSSADRPKAYFLEGHGEHSIMSGDTNSGYTTFAAIIRQNWVEPLQLHSLLGSNAVPMDCNLLIIPGPQVALQDIELQKIDRYLGQGGRLLVMFNFNSVGRQTGLEKLLANWGVEVGANRIKDPDNTVSEIDIMVSNFSKHSLVNALVARLHLIEPRSIAKLKSKGEAADAPRVEEIAFSADTAFAQADKDHKHAFPLMAAVEKGDKKGVITASTRMVIIGDSIFLGNQMIESSVNRDFAGYLINWLLDRSQLLEGVVSRPVSQYRSTMTHQQFVRAQWILLAGMPSSALFLGSLVWLRRRK
jgi:hypothetical protein